MATFRQIQTAMWGDAWVQAQDPEAKLLFIYLFSNPASSITGLYKITLKTMAFDTGLETDRIIELLADFERDGKVIYSEGVVFVRRMLANHTTRSSRLMMGLRRDVDSIADGGPKRAFMAVYGALLGYRKGSKDNVFAIPNTLSGVADNVSDTTDNVSDTTNTLSDDDDNVLPHTIPYHNITEQSIADVEEYATTTYTGNNIQDPYHAAQVYTEVTGHDAMPIRDREKALEAIYDLQHAANVRGENVVEKLRPYWEAWQKGVTKEGMPYSSTGYGWLDWAIGGRIPNKEPPRNKSDGGYTHG